MSLGSRASKKRPAPTRAPRRDALVFAADDGRDRVLSLNKPWLVLVADDEAEIHHVTKLALAGMTFKDRPLALLDAYSRKEAMKLLHKHPDIAIILLDVVMEEDHSGLKLAQYIREQLKNPFMRIVIRTGQPGQAPERDVVVNYDVNDYKEKAELTSQKLFSLMIALLRAYDSLTTIESNRASLHALLEMANSLSWYRQVDDFATHALADIFGVLRIPVARPAEMPDALLAFNKSGDFVVSAAYGRFASAHGQPASTVLTATDQRLLAKHFKSGARLVATPTRVSCKLQSKTELSCFIHIADPELLRHTEPKIIELLFATLSSAFDNLCLAGDIVATQSEVLFTLSQVVEARSHETGHHVRRVAEYSWLLAKKYGLDDEEANLLRQAAALHDIGKVAVLDQILNKPSRLEPAEFELMKRHTTVGRDILQASKRRLFVTAAIVAMQHHERYDGKGYPLGLAGKAIHLYGRIVSLADVFDAVGSNRKYKAAWSIEEVLAYLKEESGKSFDPKLVDLLFANLDSILVIRERFRDTDVSRW